MSVIPYGAFTPLSIMGTQRKADALLVVGRHWSDRWGTASTAHRKGVKLASDHGPVLPPLAHQNSHLSSLDSISSSVRWRLK